MMNRIHSLLGFLVFTIISMTFLRRFSVQF